MAGLCNGGSRLVSPRGQCRPALDIWFDLIAECGLALPPYGALRGVGLAVAAAEEILKTNELTKAISVARPDSTAKSAGRHSAAECGCKRRSLCKTIALVAAMYAVAISCSARHRPFAGSSHRFPTEKPVIDVARSFSRPAEAYESSATSSENDRLKMIVTVGVDFIPGWSGARPTPGLEGIASGCPRPSWDRAST